MPGDVALRHRRYKSTQWTVCDLNTYREDVFVAAVTKQEVTCLECLAVDIAAPPGHSLEGRILARKGSL